MSILIVRVEWMLCANVHSDSEQHEDMFHKINCTTARKDTLKWRNSAIEQVQNNMQTRFGLFSLTPGFKVNVRGELSNR